MGCSGCTVCSSKPNGCGSNGCATGGCNKLNTYDWLSTMEIPDSESFNMVEVSFKNGARKGFYRNQGQNRAATGDMVVVETSSGFDVGRVALSGELVRLQMKKKKVTDDAVLFNIIRKANERDLERLTEARLDEKKTMIRSRVIARMLGLEMKIGDVEYQGDKRKATFYYTADGRVDFRELIRHYAKEFRVKIEMRQIGARQESARIGGIGSCGRELCCSTWLTDFKSVSTAAARYQNLAINQSKLSGQCGRLKCCLNYELDTYLDALDDFPEQADKLETQKGIAHLLKTDIFKQIMYYSLSTPNGKGKIVAIDIDRVKEIQEMNRRGEKPADLVDLEALMEELEELPDFGDVTGAIELPDEKRRRKKKKKKKKPGANSGNNKSNKQNGVANKSNEAKNKQENKPGTPNKKGKPQNDQQKKNGGAPSGGAKDGPTAKQDDKNSNQKKKYHNKRRKNPRNNRKNNNNNRNNTNSNPDNGGDKG